MQASVVTRERMCACLIPSLCGPGDAHLKVVSANSASQGWADVGWSGGVSDKKTRTCRAAPCGSVASNLMKKRGALFAGNVSPTVTHAEHSMAAAPVFLLL